MNSIWRNETETGGWAPNPSPITRGLLIASCVVYVVQAIFRSQGTEAFDRYFALSGYGIRQGWIWQFVTHMFLHGGFLHLFFNMISLYFFGTVLEGILGPGRYLRIFVLGGFAGGALWLVFNWSVPIASVVGASGAICAVSIAYSLLDADGRVRLWGIPVTIQARHFAIIFVLSSIFLPPLLSPLLGITGNIAYLAHLGGAILGFIYAMTIRSGWRCPWEAISTRSPSSRMDAIEIFKHDEFMQQRIDPILDKIAERGIQSLTEDERRLLESMKDKRS